MFLLRPFVFWAVRVFGRIALFLSQSSRVPNPPYDYRERLQSIFYLKQQRRFEEALEQVALLENEGVRAVDLWVEKADALARLKRPKHALEVLESARLQFPLLPPYGRALLGGLLQNAKRLEEAREEFEGLSEQPRVSLAVARRTADFFADHGGVERVPAMLERWAGDTPEWYRLRGRYGPDEERSLLLRRGLERFPDDKSLFEDYVMQRMKHEPPEATARELEALLTVGSHSQSLRLRERLAQTFRELKEPQRALDLMLECVRREPGNGYFLANVGYVYRELGQPEQALDYLERALEVRSEDRYAVNALVKTCRESGQSLRAVEFFQQRLAVAPQDRALLHGFLSACRDADRRATAEEYISNRARENGALWGAFQRVFKTKRRKAK